jgi:Protein of unknown function (DUF3522)
MSVSDLFHSLFIILTTCSYWIPIIEALQRNSTFYTSLFTSLFTVSFLLHLDEAGLYSGIKEDTHERLQLLSLGLSYYLFNVMSLVVLEVRNEFYSRIVMGAFVIFITLRDITDMKFNVVGSLAITFCLFFLDIIMYSRKFSAAYWRRLLLIIFMILIGIGLFKLINKLWIWHGIWHGYMSLTTYLLLLAQRHKRMLAMKAAKAKAATGNDGNRDTIAYSSSNSQSSLQYQSSKRRQGQTSSHVEHHSDQDELKERDLDV